MVNAVGIPLASSLPTVLFTILPVANVNVNQIRFRRVGCVHTRTRSSSDYGDTGLEILETG